MLINLRLFFHEKLVIMGVQDWRSYRHPSPTRHTAGSND